MSRLLVLLLVPARQRMSLIQDVHKWPGQMAEYDVYMTYIQETQWLHVWNRHTEHCK